MNNRLVVRFAWIIAAPLLALAGIATAVHAGAVWAANTVLDLDPMDGEDEA